VPEPSLNVLSPGARPADADLHGLARLEGKVALEALIPELPGLKAREPQLEFIDSYLVRGIEKFDLVPRVDC